MTRRVSPGLVPARFDSRPNRFVVMARLSDGSGARCHLADPGRLRELLLPGAELRLRPASDGLGRSTAWTVALVRAPSPSRVWVSVDTSAPNRLAASLLVRGRVPGISVEGKLRREVRHGASRFDFAVPSPDGGETLVEVKSVSLVERGRALFPDAPTARGARHVRELTRHVRAGGRAMVLFVVQRPDARSVSSNPRTDPAFAEALGAAGDAGVMLRGVRFRFDGSGRARFEGAIPVR